MEKSSIYFLLIAIMFSPVLAHAQVATSTSFILNETVIDAGGGRATSTNFNILQNLNEIGIGNSTSTNFQIEGGFLSFPTDTLTSGGDSSGSTDTGGGSVGGGGIIAGILGQQSTTSTTTRVAEEIEATTIIPSVPEIIDGLADIISPIIPPFLKPKTPRITLPPLDVSKEPPFAFSRRWKLIDPETIQRFVFEPLPKSISTLVKKFPNLDRIFNELGVTRLSDLDELRKAKLGLPTLSEIKDIPTEIVFARAGDKLIDFSLSLDIDIVGEIKQSLRTVAGKTLNLVVRPEYAANRVRGFLVLRESVFSEEEQVIPGNSLLASLIFSEGGLGETVNEEIFVEDRLLIASFDYLDLDGDGIYTADVEAPLVQGFYEVITIVDYENPDLGKKELRLTVIVDPEGYIYEIVGSREFRVPDAHVSIYSFDKETGQFLLWPARDFQQHNPQTTNQTGEYSFLVPTGTYYLKVDASGYNSVVGEPFEVVQGRGVHENIELIPLNGGWLPQVDFKWVVIVILALFVFYNFYRATFKKRAHYIVDKSNE